MSDISNQLIKDSYNYVLQSDLSTGVVYRIGGTIPVNPIFQSGLTVNSGFTYSNGTEQNGYALLTDGTGYAYWGPVSAATPSSGVTSITVGNGLSANSTTGNVTIVFTGQTSVSGLTYYVTGSTPSGSFINGDRWFNSNTGDELVWIDDGDSQQWIQICCGSGGGGGSTIQGITGITATSGLSANTNDYQTTIINTAPDQTVTISGGTGITTGGTYPNFTITNSLPDQTVVITGGTNIQIVSSYPNFGVNFTGTTGSNFTGGTVTGATNFTNGLTANTISATTYQNLPSSFQSVRIDNTTQFSADTGNFINFSGINITITSAATNTLVFSAATGGGGSSSGVTQIIAGSGISISPIGGTGYVTINSTTVIASSSCVVIPDSTIYVGNSIYGWNDTTWNLNNSSFVNQNINCGIPLPIDVLKDKTITICGMAYINDSDPVGNKLDFGVYLYRFDCANVYRDGITIVSSEVTNDAFDFSGFYCFNLSYTIPSQASQLFSCNDFIVVGFSSDTGDATELRVTYTVKII